MEKRKKLPNILAERLKTFRKAAGLTQKDMANELTKRGVEITQQSYARYENNNASPDYDTLMKLAVILKTDVNSLLGFGISEEKFFNKVTRGKTTATRDGDNVIIELEGKTFSMPLQEFKEYVTDAKMIAGGWTRMEFEKIFYESMFLDFSYYLTKTRYKTIVSNSKQENLPLEQYMDVLTNKLNEANAHFREKMKLFEEWKKETGDDD